MILSRNVLTTEAGVETELQASRIDGGTEIKGRSATRKSHRLLQCDFQPERPFVRTSVAPLRRGSTNRAPTKSKVLLTKPWRRDSGSFRGGAEKATLKKRAGVPSCNTLLPESGPTGAGGLCLNQNL